MVNSLLNVFYFIFKIQSAFLIFSLIALLHNSKVITPHVGRFIAETKILYLRIIKLPHIVAICE